MAYDVSLAERIREHLSLREEVTERSMFGGIAWMVRGNMACGVLGDELIVRVGPEEGEKALAEPHTRPFDFTGRPSRGIVYVSAQGIEDDEVLAGWIDAGAGHAGSLPPK